MKLLTASLVVSPDSAMEDSKNKKLIAYHEVGRATIGSLLQNHDAVEKVTLIPRGSSKGLTWFAPSEEGLACNLRHLGGGEMIRCNFQCVFCEVSISLYYSFGQVFAEFHHSFIEIVMRVAFDASYLE